MSRQAWATAMALALSACGGGGGGTAPPVVAQTAPASTSVAGAYSAIVRGSRSYSLTGSTSTGVALTASLSIAPAAAVAYSGTTYDRAVLTVIVRQGAAQLSSAITTLWLMQGTTNQALIGYSDGDCAVTTSGAALPTTAGIGSSGAYFEAKKWSGCSALGDRVFVQTGTVTGTWSYSTVNGTGWVCINSSVSGFVTTTTESDCFEVADAAGTLTGRVRITTRDGNGVTTTLTN